MSASSLDEQQLLQKAKDELGETEEVRETSVAAVRLWALEQTSVKIVLGESIICSSAAISELANLSHWNV